MPLAKLFRASVSACARVLSRPSLTSTMRRTRPARRLVERVESRGHAARDVRSAAGGELPDALGERFTDDADAHERLEDLGRVRVANDRDLVVVAHLGEEPKHGAPCLLDLLAAHRPRGIEHHGERDGRALLLPGARIGIGDHPNVGKDRGLPVVQHPGVTERHHPVRPGPSEGGRILPAREHAGSPKIPGKCRRRRLVEDQPAGREHNCTERDAAPQPRRHGNRHGR